MRLWDESMFAVNTYEMMHNGHYFSTYFNGLPDIYNTKPPITIWLQILSVKAFGYNELAIRLPSAIAAALSILILFIFIARKYSFLWAWLSALILITSAGFTTFHTARTGDSDSLLNLFLVIANIYFIRSTIEDKKQTIFWFLLFISLAFATKMFAAFLFFPAYLAVLIIKKKLNYFIVNKFFFAGIFIFILLNGGLILLREWDTPGYLNVLLYKDAGRLFTIVDNHQQPFTFYLDNLFNYRYNFWFALLVAGLIMSFIIKQSNERILLRIASLLILSYLSIIMLSITKLEWYDMPLYPYFSIVAAYPTYILTQHYLESVHNVRCQRYAFEKSVHL